MARRTGQRPHSRNWTGQVFASSALSVTQAIFGVPITVGTSDVTLLRSRGEIIIFATPDAASDDDVVGLGIIVVQEAAATVGGTSVPGPVNDIDADWLWHRFVGLDGGAVSAADSASILTNRIIEIDSKAMRRVKRDQVIVLVAELSTGQFGAVRMSGGFRLLTQQ